MRRRIGAVLFSLLIGNPSAPLSAWAAATAPAVDPKPRLVSLAAQSIGSQLDRHEAALAEASKKPVLAELESLEAQLRQLEARIAPEVGEASERGALLARMLPLRIRLERKKIEQFCLVGPTYAKAFPADAQKARQLAKDTECELSRLLADDAEFSEDALRAVAARLDALEAEMRRLDLKPAELAAFLQRIQLAKANLRRFQARAPAASSGRPKSEPAARGQLRRAADISPADLGLLYDNSGKALAPGQDAASAVDAGAPAGNAAPDDRPLRPRVALGFSSVPQPEAAPEPRPVPEQGPASRLRDAFMNALEPFEGLTQDGRAAAFDRNRAALQSRLREYALQALLSLDQPPEEGATLHAMDAVLYGLRDKAPEKPALARYLAQRTRYQIYVQQALGQGNVRPGTAFKPWEAALDAAGVTEVEYKAHRDGTTEYFGLLSRFNDGTSRFEATRGNTDLILVEDPRDNRTVITRIERGSDGKPSSTVTTVLDARTGKKVHEETADIAAQLVTNTTYNEAGEAVRVDTHNLATGERRVESRADGLVLTSGSDGSAVVTPLVPNGVWTRQTGAMDPKTGQFQLQRLVRTDGMTVHLVSPNVARVAATAGDATQRFEVNLSRLVGPSGLRGQGREDHSWALAREIAKALGRGENDRGFTEPLHTWLWDASLKDEFSDARLYITPDGEMNLIYRRPNGTMRVYRASYGSSTAYQDRPSGEMAIVIKKPIEADAQGRGEVSPMLQGEYLSGGRYNQLTADTEVQPAKWYGRNERRTPLLHVDSFVRSDGAPDGWRPGGRVATHRGETQVMTGTSTISWVWNGLTDNAVVRTGTTFVWGGVTSIGGIFSDSSAMIASEQYANNPILRAAFDDQFHLDRVPSSKWGELRSWMVDWRVRGLGQQGITRYNTAPGAFDRLMAIRPTNEELMDALAGRPEMKHIDRILRIAREQGIIPPAGQTRGSEASLADLTRMALQPLQRSMLGIGDDVGAIDAARGGPGGGLPDLGDAFRRAMDATKLTNPLLGGMTWPRAPGLGSGGPGSSPSGASGGPGAGGSGNGSGQPGPKDIAGAGRQLRDGSAPARDQAGQLLGSMDKDLREAAEKAEQGMASPVAAAPAISIAGPLKDASAAGSAFDGSAGGTRQPGGPGVSVADALRTAGAPAFKTPLGMPVRMASDAKSGASGSPVGPAGAVGGISPADIQLAGQAQTESQKPGIPLVGAQLPPNTPIGTSNNTGAPPGGPGRPSQSVAFSDQPKPMEAKLRAVESAFASLPSPVLNWGAVDSMSRYVYEGLVRLGGKLLGGPAARPGIAGLQPVLGAEPQAETKSTGVQITQLRQVGQLGQQSVGGSQLPQVAVQTGGVQTGEPNVSNVGGSQVALGGKTQTAGGRTQLPQTARQAGGVENGQPHVSNVGGTQVALGGKTQTAGGRAQLPQTVSQTSGAQTSQPRINSVDVAQTIDFDSPKTSKGKAELPKNVSQTRGVQTGQPSVSNVGVTQVALGGKTQTAGGRTELPQTVSQTDGVQVAQPQAPSLRPQPTPMRQPDGSPRTWQEPTRGAVSRSQPANPAPRGRELAREPGSRPSPSPERSWTPAQEPTGAPSMGAGASGAASAGGAASQGRSGKASMSNSAPAAPARILRQPWQAPVEPAQAVAWQPSEAGRASRAAQAAVAEPEPASQAQAQPQAPVAQRIWTQSVGSASEPMRAEPVRGQVPQTRVAAAVEPVSSVAQTAQPQTDEPQAAQAYEPFQAPAMREFRKPVFSSRGRSHARASMARRPASSRTVSRQAPLRAQAARLEAPSQPVKAARAVSYSAYRAPTVVPEPERPMVSASRAAKPAHVRILRQPGEAKPPVTSSATQTAKASPKARAQARAQACERRRSFSLKATGAGLALAASFGSGGIDSGSGTPGISGQAPSGYATALLGAPDLAGALTQSAGRSVSGQPTLRSGAPVLRPRQPYHRRSAKEQGRLVQPGRNVRLSSGLTAGRPVRAAQPARPLIPVPANPILVVLLLASLLAYGALRLREEEDELPCSIRAA